MGSLVDVIAGQGSAGCSAAGNPSAGKAGETLADFLESDLQGSARSASMVIERIDAIKSGRQESWSRTGNQYVLTLRSDQAILEDIYPADSAEKPVTIALSEFEDAVSLWLEALKSLRRDR